MEYVSIARAAKVLGLSVATIRNRLRSGVWPCHRFGERAIRINLDELASLTRCDSKQEDSETQKDGAQNDRLNIRA
jgi:excisionase family DNA binding protein